MAARTATAPKTIGRRFHAVDVAVRRTCSPTLGCQTTPPDTAVGALEEMDPGRWAATSMRNVWLTRASACCCNVLASTPELPTCWTRRWSARAPAPARSTVPENEVFVRRSWWRRVRWKSLKGPVGPFSSATTRRAPAASAKALDARTQVRPSPSFRGPTMVQPARLRSSTRSCCPRSGIWRRASASRPTPARTTPLPLAWVSTPRAIVTRHPLHNRSANETRRKVLRGADNQQRALDVVADLVGHRAQEEAAGARHALVADHQEVVVAL